MNKKAICVEKKVKELLGEMKKSYGLWQHYHDHGGNDPFYPDGVNMNLIRNHTLYYKNQIRELCKENGLQIPAEVNMPELPRVEYSYMARVDEIIIHANEALKEYEASSDYQYLIENAGKLNESEMNDICLSNICGYVTGLKIAVEKNDLVTMRRHENGEMYIGCFRSCAEKMREILSTHNEPEYQQLSLF